MPTGEALSNYMHLGHHVKPRTSRRRPSSPPHAAHLRKEGCKKEMGSNNGKRPGSATTMGPRVYNWRHGNKTRVCESRWEKNASYQKNSAPLKLNTWVNEGKRAQKFLSISWHKHETEYAKQSKLTLV